MDPVSVLLDHVPVKFMNHETSAFPPGITSEPKPSTCSSHSDPAEVLEKLSFIDLSDTVTTNWDKSSADLSS